MLWLERDLKTFLRNVHFPGNAKDDESDTGRSFIKYFNQNVSNSVSNHDSKSIDKHMLKFHSEIQALNITSKTSRSNEVSSFGMAVLVK